MSSTDVAQAEPATHTVDEFCRLERKSRAMLYREWAAGGGPRYYYNGNRRRISEEARLEYRRQKEAEALGEVANGTS